MKNVSVYCSKGIRIDKKKTINLVIMLAKEFGCKVSSIEANFIDSGSILEINRKYLGHNYCTDIITFDYSYEKNNLDGELFISLPEAAENSKKYRVSIDDELSRLIIHGILHLIGYDDKTPAEKKIMKIQEDKFIKKYQKNMEGLLIKNDCQNS